MNDAVNYNFSFGYQLQLPDKGPETAKDLIAFDDCLEYPLPNQQMLLQSRRNGKRVAVTYDVLHALHQCSKFRTFDEHVAHLANAIPELSGQTDDIRQVLSTINKAGLMASAKEFVRQLQPAVESLPAQPSPVYCVLTCDRPEALSRLLVSMTDNHDFDAAARYFVVDDSRQEENRQRNRQIAEGHALTYFGEKEQAQFIARLKAALPHHATGIDFLLGRAADSDRPSYGRTRNFALLLGIDARVVLSDDDILFNRCRPDRTSDQVALTSRPRQAQFWSEPEWRSMRDDEAPDPTTGAFTSALGRTLPQALAGLGDRVLAADAVRDLLPYQLPVVTPASQVLVTACGYLGDPGTASNDWIYQLPAESREQLLHSEADYRHFSSARNAWLGSPGYHFVNHFSLISGITGLDNQTLLPPYFPLYRNEDFLFGAMTHFMYPDALLLDLPWAVPHLPLQQRKWNRNTLEKPASYGFLDFTVDYLDSRIRQTVAAPGNSRLRTLSRLFSDLSTTTESQLLELLTDQTLRLRSARLQQISEVLEESKKAPGYWKADLGRILEVNTQGLMDPPPSGFLDLSDSPDQPLQHAQQLWGAYALGLAAWEEIRQAARTIAP